MKIKHIIPLGLSLALFATSCGGSSTTDTAVEQLKEETTEEVAEIEAKTEEVISKVEEVKEEAAAKVEEVKEEATAKVEEAVSTAKEEVKAVVSGKSKSLTTSIPEVSVVGTPMPIKVPNLKQKPNRAPSIQVPESTKLLSKGKTVTSSDDFPIIGELSLITDGDKDAGEGYYVELLDGLQWVQVDLGASYTLEGVWIWHYHAQDRAYNDVIVQVSDDADFSSGVKTIYNNDYDNSADLGKGSDKPYVESNFGLLVNAKKAKGRYVRLYSNNNSATEANNYIEVEVYGN